MGINIIRGVELDIMEELDIIDNELIFIECENGLY